MDSFKSVVMFPCCHLDLPCPLSDLYLSFVTLHSHQMTDSETGWGLPLCPEPVLALALLPIPSPHCLPIE